MEPETSRTQEILLKAALTLTSDLALDSVLQRIVEFAAEISGARYGALGVLGPGGQHIQEFLTHGITDEQRRLIGELPKGHGLLGALIRDARPLRLKRIQEDARSVGFPNHHPPMVSFLGVPIAIKGGVFGNLYLTEKRDADEFTEADEDAVVTLAAHAAVAVENARLYQRARHARRRLAAINEILQGILSGRATDEVLTLVTSRAQEFTGARLTIIATADRDGTLSVRAGHGERSGPLIGMHFPEAGSICGDVVRSGLPIGVPDAEADGRKEDPIVQAGFGPALFAPIAMRDRTYGALAVAASKDDREFDEQTAAVVQVFAAQAGVALDYARLQDELQRLALVEDRERIAKELHDDIVQSLFAEGMALQASLGVVDDPRAMQQRINQTVEHIDRIIRDLRGYIFALRPGARGGDPFHQAIRSMVASFQRGTTARIEISVDPAAERHAGRLATDLLQSAREAISNAVRHARPGRIDVALMRAGDSLVLEVADDGTGFDPTKMSELGHGLANLAERAKTIGGELEIESEQGRGTWVRIRIPLEDG